MPTPNADDPLWTTDHAPVPEAPTETVTTVARLAPEMGNVSPSLAGNATFTFQPKQDPSGDGSSATPSQPPSIPGYEIEGLLGRGGMGVVYKARHLALKRTVALKMVLAGGHAGPAELVRFRIEAEAVARLQHSNIVQVFEVGAADGHPYCALEFIEGGNLAGKLDGRPLPAREAARLVEALARAMQLAHSRNVVHRDLKPANVLLAADGTPKITDFGLARQTDSDSGETQAGAIMGTPSYMAPEQASGRAHEAGVAADVYALGAILYDCLAGRPPFKGQTVVETLDQVRHQEPVPPSRWEKSVPPDLETICLKCLRKEPEKRYASAAELADDLVRYQRGEPIRARPVGGVERAVKWVKRNPVVTAMAVAVVLALAVGTTVSYLKYRETEAARLAAAQRVTERDEALGKADAALIKAAERVKERDEANKELKHRLGISDMLLAGAAYDNRDVVLAAERLDKVPSEQRGWEWRYLKQQVRGGLFTLEAHTGPVTSVSFSPDGTRLLTGSGWPGRRGEAKVWDARTGTLLLELKELPPLPGGLPAVMTASFSPDGTRVVTAFGKTVTVWDARTGMALLDLKGHLRTVQSVAFSPDGTRLVTGGGDKTMKVWDARTGMALLELKGHRVGVVNSVSFSPDGTRIVSGSGPTATVWDARTGMALLDLKGFEGGVHCVSFSPDGTRIAVGDYATAMVMDARAGTALVETKGRVHVDTSNPMLIGRHGVLSLSFSPDGRRIVTGGSTVATVWDGRTGTALLDLKGHTIVVNSVSFSPDGTRIVTGSANGTVKVWDAHAESARLELKGHAGPVSSVAFSPDGTRLVTGGGEAGKPGEATVWHAHTGMALFELKGFKATVNSVAFSPDGTRIVTGGGSYGQPGEATVWDARTGAALVELKGFKEGVNSVAFSPDGTRTVTAGFQDYNSGGTELKVWDARSGTVLLDVTPPDLGPGRFVGARGGSVAFSPDGTRIVSGGIRDLKNGGGTWATVWDARTGTRLVELKGQWCPVLSVSFSPDGTRIVTGNSRGTATVWDAGSGTALVELKGHTSYVNSAAFSPDGTRIVTGGADRTVRVWDARTGTALVELKEHLARITSVAFSPDGTRIVAGGGEFGKPGQATVWDARTASLELKGHTGQISSVSFNSDGTRIVTGSYDMTAKVWNARTGTPLLELRHKSLVTSVSFSVDGTQLVTGCNDTTAKVWDALTGKELLNEPIPQALQQGQISPDGCFFARIADSHVELIPLKPDAEEIAYRLHHTRPNAWRYQEGYAVARKAKDDFAARFYLDRILSLPKQRITKNFQERNDFQADPLLIARTGFHHPALAKTPYDCDVVALLALHPDRLAQRLVAQELVRDGKPEPALPLLFWCLASRPATSPPVEELLLAQAYLDLKQPDEAKRFHKAATEWLDRPREPRDGFGVGFEPIDDPRRNPFDWEVWNECDVFRAKVERRLAGKP